MWEIKCLYCDLFRVHSVVSPFIWVQICGKCGVLLGLCGISFFGVLVCARGDVTSVDNPNNVDITSKFEIHKAERIFMAVI